MSSTTIIKRAAFAIPVLILLAVFIFRYSPLIMAGLMSVEVLLMIVVILVLFVYLFVKILRTIK